MNKLIIAIVALMTMTSQAQNLQCQAADNKQVDVVTQCPKVKERWRTVVKKVEVPRVIVKTRTVVKTVKVPVTKVKYIKQIQKRKYVKKVNVRKNHFIFLAGASDTKLEAEQFTEHVSKAENKHEFDVGIQYLRELGEINASALVTKNGQVYLGVGLSW